MATDRSDDLMTPDFNLADSSTWPVVLTPDHVAAIFARTVLAVKKACQTHRFMPAPFQSHPYRWRKADVLRHVEGTRRISWLRGAS